MGRLKLQSIPKIEIFVETSVNSESPNLGSLIFNRNFIKKFLTFYTFTCNM
nr:MAG TPA: hypothetical protein [Caudoviricetes sp.]